MKMMVPILLAGTCTLCACSTTGPHYSNPRDVEAIADFNRQYLKAINEGDSRTLSELTDPDIVTIEPNWKPIEGKEANDKANRQSLKLFKIEEKWTPVETVVDGDLAYQRGVYTETATPRTGGPSHLARGNFLRIYRRQHDGSWHLTRDMTSSDQPMAIPRARTPDAS